MDAVKRLAAEEGATLFMTLFAPYQVMLSYFSGQHHFTVGTTSSNRNQLECEGLMGFFNNVLTIKVDLNGALSFRQLLGQVKNVVLDAFHHQEVSHDHLTREIARETGKTPLHRAYFTLQNAFSSHEVLKEARAQPFPFSFDIAHHQLALLLKEDGVTGKMDGMLVCNPCRFNTEMATRMLNVYSQLLKNMCHNPDQEIFLDLPEDLELWGFEKA